MRQTNWPADPRGVLLSLAALLALAGSASAQVQWRYDYNAARREAAEKGRPILLDFGTENCMWCKRLDATTFKDPAIAAALNGQFVPLKIDADREPALAQTLRIQRYPTLLLAAPDGKILGFLEGYLEPDRLNEHLQRAQLAVATPDWMARDYQEATRAVSAGDYARAVALLKTIGQDGKQRPVQAKARQVLADLEQQAAGRLAKAKQMDDKGQSLEAVDLLTDVLRTYAGTQAAADSSQLLSTLAAKPEVRERQRSRRARELLAQAKEEYRGQQYLACLDRCEVLTGTYSDLPEGAEAAQLAGEVKSDPERLAKICDSLDDRRGAMYLALAESWMKKGDAKQAALCLEKVVKEFPGTPRSEAAQVRLARLQGRPTQQAEFKKP